MSLAAPGETRSPANLRRALPTLRWETALVALVTLAALLVRVTQLHQSLFGDEVLAYNEIVGHTLAGLIRTVSSGVESSPPLFFLLAWLATKLGDPTILIRLPTLVLGVATIPLVYLLGRDTLGRGVGAVGAAALALSPFSTYYGVEARPYATLAFCLTLSTFALVRAVRTGHWRWWALYAVAAAAAAYTHYTAIFVLGVQGVWSLWACRDRLRQPLFAAAGACVLYLPWLPQVHGSYLGVYALLEPLTLANVSRDVLRLIPGYPYATLPEIPTLAGLYAVGACACAGVLALMLHRPDHQRVAANGPPPPAQKPVLIVTLALATPAGLLLFSVLGTDIWDARDLYGSAPAACLVLGLLLMAIPRPASLIATVVVLAVLAAGTVKAVTPRYQRTAFRAAARYLDRVAKPTDPIVFYPFLLNLDYAIPAQFTKPHQDVFGIPKQWPSVPSSGSDWIVFEPAMARKLHLALPAPPGMRLIAVRRYGGLSPFRLLRYALDPPGR